MALSADASPVIRNGATMAMKVLTAAVVYNFALCSHDTTTGAIKPYDGTGADRLVGWHFGSTVTGLTTAAVPPRAFINPGGFVAESLTVATLAGSDADLGKPVWATDDGTYTVTDPGGTDQQVGWVVRRRSSTTADVYLKNVMGQVGS